MKLNKPIRSGMIAGIVLSIPLLIATNSLNRSESVDIITSNNISIRQSSNLESSINNVGESSDIEIDTSEISHIEPKSNGQNFLPENNRVIENITTKPALYFTFDDGSTELTQTLLNVLESYPQVKVTFFPNCAEKIPGTYQRILDQGHAIGSHTCSHPYLTRLNHSQIINEFVSHQNFINSKINSDLQMTCYRPPYGDTSNAVRASAASLGLREWTWSNNTDDYKRPGVDVILSRLETMQNGDITVLHDSNGKEQSVEAFRRFLEKHINNYEFKSLPGCATAIPSGWNGAFYDDDNSNFEQDIEFLYSNGITKGCAKNKYCVNKNVTREEMATFLARTYKYLVGKEAPPADTPFTDVPNTSFAKADISKIYALGITRGTSKTTYSPRESVDREQMATFLARLYKVAGGEETKTIEIPFKDVNKKSYGYESIKLIYTLGVTKGTCSTSYSPNREVTRGEMAAFIHRLADVIN